MLFLSSQKLFSFFRCLNFCPHLFSHVGKRLDKKVSCQFIMSQSKLMTSHTGKQTIAINILPDISKSKGNQTMKLGKLVEYSVKNIFLQTSCRK